MQDKKLPRKRGLTRLFFTLSINGPYWAFARKESLPIRYKLILGKYKLERQRNSLSVALACGQSIAVPLTLFEGGLLCAENYLF